MEYQLFSFNALEQELDSYEFIEDKIERLSTEILNCRNSITDLKNNLENISISQIIFDSEDEKLTKIINDVLKDQRLDNILMKEIELPPNGRHVKKVLNYFVGGVYGSKKEQKV